MLDDARTRILMGALEILRDPAGPALTLESAARHAGLSKPGLMYHFPNKDALVSAVIAHAADRWEAELLNLLGADRESSSIAERIGAYVRQCFESDFDLADLAVYFDAHYRAEFTAIWQSRIGPWIDLPETLPAEERAYLTAARLIADAFWLSKATSVGQPLEDELPHLRALTAELIGSAS